MEVNPPSYAQDGCYTAQQDRQILAGMICSDGVQNRRGGDMLVTPSTEGLAVDVAAGEAYIAGDDVQGQGMYFVVNDASKRVELAAADQSDPRIDLVIAQVRDSEYQGDESRWDIIVLTGTPSPEPQPPSLPGNAIRLAEITVPAGASSVAAENIRDRREQAALCDQLCSCPRSWIATVQDDEVFGADGRQPSTKLRVRGLPTGQDGFEGSYIFEAMIIVQANCANQRVLITMDGATWSAGGIGPAFNHQTGEGGDARFISVDLARAGGIWMGTGENTPADDNRGIPIWIAGIMRARDAEVGFGFERESNGCQIVLERGSYWKITRAVAP